MLAVATAVNNANIGAGGGPSAVLDGFHAALLVSLGVAVLGVAATTLRRRSNTVAQAEPA